MRSQLAAIGFVSYMFYSNWLVGKLRAWLRIKGRDAAHPHDLSEDEKATFERDEDENSAGELDVDLFNPFPDPVVIEITDVFDLHTIAPRDVKIVVVEYLRAAHAAGFRTVRIIHGKGTGTQREMVRNILAFTPFVTSFYDAPPDAGGWGATIAHFSRNNR
ncbi:MAG TPA: Smr/MutS family protein [Pyrinomonadaceae bacterium]|nr:Smr/MutS family protein [Pyrinomonadaceae bacterium]